MECETLDAAIKWDIKAMRSEGSPNFIIEEHVIDMQAGEAIICVGCEKYEQCFGGNADSKPTEKGR